MNPIKEHFATYHKCKGLDYCTVKLNGTSDVSTFNNKVNKLCKIRLVNNIDLVRFL